MVVYSDAATYYRLPTTYYVLPTTYYLLPTTYYLLPTTCYLLPTTYYYCCYYCYYYYYHHHYLQSRGEGGGLVGALELQILLGEFVAVDFKRSRFTMKWSESESEVVHSDPAIDMSQSNGCLF